MQPAPPPCLSSPTRVPLSAPPLTCQPSALPTPAPCAADEASHGLLAQQLSHVDGGVAPRRSHQARPSTAASSEGGNFASRVAAVLVQVFRTLRNPHIWAPALFIFCWQVRMCR